MTADETLNIINLLNLSWSQAPLPEATATIWATQIRKLEHGPTKAAIMRLVASQKFRPSLAEIMAEAAPELRGETAFEAFEAVRRAQAYAIGDREHRISPEAMATVKRLGGWSALAHWRDETMDHHRRHFVDAFEDALDRFADNARHGLPAPARPKAIPAKVEDEPAYIKPDRITEMLNNAMTRWQQAKGQQRDG